MYKAIIRPLLFLFRPENAHHITFNLLGWLYAIPGIKGLLSALFSIKNQKLEVEFCGLTFPNRVGLAAGFDKDAKALHPLSRLGFGFIEVGTVTPLPQPGNDRPRLFRLPKDGALINRMGFNNEGLEAMVKRLKKRPKSIIVGGNIGRNKITPNEEAHLDYLKCLESLYDFVDYFVVNISSPNTPGLRELQEKAPLKDLLLKLKGKMEELGGNKPLMLKIAPDLMDRQLEDIAEILIETRMDGVVATNTTIQRNDLKSSASFISKIGGGGLSGAPVMKRSDEVISFLRKQLGKDFLIIGVGGIMSPGDALKKLRAGADLVQIYTGFIYQGPTFVKRINKAILKEFEQ